MARPRKHKFDIPVGLPHHVYKQVLNREKKNQKREKKLIEIIRESCFQIRKIVKATSMMKNIPHDLRLFLDRQKCLLNYYDHYVDKHVHNFSNKHLERVK